jgi:DNA polymerase I-like protein with 3'-5' exonuclease and polymerase domains
MTYAYIDVETTGLDARKDRLRIVSINGTAYDVDDSEQFIAVRKWLDSHKHQTFVAQNAQFDLDFLAEHMGIRWEGPIYDTMVAYQLINAGRRRSASLDNIAMELLGIYLDKSFQKYRWDGAVDNQMLDYAAQDTKILEPLVRELNAGMDNAEVRGIFNLEMALLPILLESRRRGVKLDVPAARRLINKLRKDALMLEKELPLITPESGEVYVDEMQDNLFTLTPTLRQIKLNPRSPAQVARYFNIPDAEEDTLRGYIKKTDDRDAKTVRDIKKLYKKASSIQKQLLDRVAYDGRIHPWFNQSFVETGRLSSREPNLQNQDRGADVRGLFVPDTGNSFVIADYSQLELRLAAYFSRDKTMLAAYKEGRDLHDETQRRIFGDPSQMDKETQKKSRTLSKNINFGLVYGGGHGVLIRFAAKSGVYITEEEATEYRNAFRSLYPGLVRWQERTGNTKPEYVRTYRGRRRYITPGEGYCTRINNIVQGSAADGMKLAMVEVGRAGILPLLNVHDEVVIECPKEEASAVATNVRDVMIGSMYRAVGMNKNNPVVPIDVEVEIAKNWAEK